MTRHLSRAGSYQVTRRPTRPPRCGRLRRPARSRQVPTNDTPRGSVCAQVRPRPDRHTASSLFVRQSSSRAGSSPKKPVMRRSRPSAASSPTSSPETATVPSGPTSSQPKRNWSWCPSIALDAPEAVVGELLLHGGGHVADAGVALRRQRRVDKAGRRRPIRDRSAPLAGPRPARRRPRGRCRRLWSDRSCGLPVTRWSVRAHCLRPPRAHPITREVRTPPHGARSSPARSGSTA